MLGWRILSMIRHPREIMKNIFVALLLTALVSGCVSDSSFEQRYAPKIEQVEAGTHLIEAARLVVGGIYTAASADRLNKIKSGDAEAILQALRSTNSPSPAETIVAVNVRHVLILRKAPAEWQPAPEHDVLWLYFVADHAIGKTDIDPFSTFRQGQCFSSQLEMAVIGAKVSGSISVGQVLLSAVLGEPIRPGSTEPENHPHSH